MTNDEQQGFAEIEKDRQMRAEAVARRIEQGMATQSDAQWLRAEYRIEPSHQDKD